MKAVNLNLLLGGVFGFLSVAFGAWAVHVLKSSVSLDDFGNVMRAIEYQQLHAALLVAIGLAQCASLPRTVMRRLNLAGLLLTMGIILFCGGIYLGRLTEIRAALRLAPAGGVSFMLGWLVLASAGLAGRGTAT